MTPAQATVLEICAHAGGRPHVFKGAQLRAANTLIESGLLQKDSLLPGGFALTKSGESYAQSQGWLASSPPAPARKSVSTAEVLRYQAKEQHGRTLRTAEHLLAEVTQLVEGLRAGAVPSTSVNPNTVAFLTGDLAKLVTLRDMLEMVEKADG